MISVASLCFLAGVNSDFGTNVASEKAFVRKKDRQNAKQYVMNSGNFFINSFWLIKQGHSVMRALYLIFSSLMVLAILLSASYMAIVK